MFPKWCFLAAAAVLFTFLSYRPAQAHPHSFVDADISFVFSRDGLTGIRERWTLDEMTTVAVLDLIGANGAEQLTPEMVTAVKKQSMGNLKKYDYFTHLSIDGKSFKIKRISGFWAKLQDGRLVYEFFALCGVKAEERLRKVKLAIFDQSFSTYVMYASEEGSGLDPTLDSHFGDPDAPAQKDDYERFSEAVGLQRYEGQARLEGSLDKFNIKTSIETAPEMTYFMDQIVPDAFVVQFSKK